MRQAPPWRRAVCAEDYRFPWSTLIAEFKFRQDPGLADLLAHRLASAVQQEPWGLEVDLLLPVPLSAQRLSSRGFNQAWELTRRLAQALGLATHANLLQRPVDTARQWELSPRDRDHNLRGSLMVAPTQQTQVKGLRVAVVDDVMTTGATFREAVRALKSAGADQVDVWAVARTP